MNIDELRRQAKGSVSLISNQNLTEPTVEKSALSETSDSPKKLERLTVKDQVQVTESDILSEIDKDIEIIEKQIEEKAIEDVLVEEENIGVPEQQEIKFVTRLNLEELDSLQKVC